MFVRIGLFLISAILLAQTGQSPAAVARKALDLLLAEKFPELSGMFTDVMKKTVTLDFMQQRVSAELKEFGQAQDIGEPVLGVEGTNSLVSFPVRFSKTSIHVQFTLNPSGRVAGMYFRPPNKPLPAMWKRPSYSKPESFSEREVTIGADPWKLGGTLAVPIGKGRSPGVVLVHGPGPNDRDETIFANKMFADVAQGLASRGYAVVRYDKRTNVYRDKMSELSYTLNEETVDDAVKAAALMRQQPEIDPDQIYVLGHSLGGYATPRIAARDGKLAGLILLAANARPIEDLALDNAEYLTRLAGDPSPAAQNRLNQLKAEIGKVKKLDSRPDNPPVMLGLPTAWLLDLKGYDPVAEAKRLRVPILCLQGQRDFQVTMKDFDLWKSALDGQKGVTFHTYAALNHLFIVGDGKSTPAEYHNAGNVSLEVIDDIASWLSHR